MFFLSNFIRRTPIELWPLASLSLKLHANKLDIPWVSTSLENYAIMRYLDLVVLCLGLYFNGVSYCK